jgi:hypothetical protein
MSLQNEWLLGEHQEMVCQPAGWKRESERQMKSMISENKRQRSSMISENERQRITVAALTSWTSLVAEAPSKKRPTKKMKSHLLVSPVGTKESDHVEVKEPTLEDDSQVWHPSPWRSCG